MPAGWDENARLNHGAWTHAPRLPLGDPYRGVCHARPADLFVPPESAQRDLCNCGYARGRCDRFPDDTPADAVRFSITGDQHERVRLVYILEKDHAPAEHGALEYAVAAAQMTSGPITELLDRQARAFIASYLRHRA
jgi:hypothetical protein